METDRRYMTRTEAEVAQYDVGLRQYMLSVYNYMASALALTGLVAYATATYAISHPDVANFLFVSPMKWVVMLAPMAFVLALSFGIQRMRASTAQLVYWAFTVAMGLSLSSIFLMYTGGSIARVFFISAATFGAMSLYGYTTKTDLTQFRGFLMMGMIGILIAGLVNIFVASSGLGFVVSVIGVLVFVGLTAYDTQRIKDEYLMVVGDTIAVAKAAVWGALSLFLDFVNLFQFLLSILGNRE